MKLRHTIVGIICTIFTFQLLGQQYIGSTYLMSFDKDFLSSEYGLVFTNGVDLYRINYTTQNLEGEVDTASGLVVLPDVKDFEYSVVAYHHGTVGSRYDVPSYGSFESQLPSIYAGFGFIAIAPDYLGLGDSKGFHPYVHAASQAWTTKDMLLAAEAFYEEQEIYYKKRVLISGYSQGGHAGMGAHRLLESEDIGYEVVAATHMSGPYDLSTEMKALLLSEEEYPLVSYLPFVALSYNEAYGIFDGDINNFFLPQYAEQIIKFYNEEIDLWDLNDILIARLNSDFGAALPSKMIVPAVLDSIIANDNHPVNVALRDNDVYDWVPIADTKLYYCGMDEQVAFQNSLTAEKVMKENGALKVQAINLNPNADHAGCVTPAITSSLFHFLAYRNLTTSTEDQLFVNELTISPNPAESDVMILNGIDSGELIDIEIYDGSGRLVKRISGVGLNQNISLSDVPRGILLVKGTNNSGNIFMAKLLRI